MIKFENKVVVVTGAGRGLGKCYALEFARRGARVVVNDVGPSEQSGGSGKAALDVVNMIKDAGGEAVADYHTVAEEEAAGEIIRTAADNYGRVDILVNNAGIVRDRSLVKMTAEDFDAVLKVHLYGSFYVTKAAFPLMKDNNWGRIIMITSPTGLYGNFGQVNYGSAKLGLVGFMNVLKEEGKRYNILVNTISPVATTPMGKDVPVPMFSEKMQPEHVAAAVLYLCSDRSQSSGDIIFAGGGYFSRVQLVVSEGAFIAGDGITPEMFEEYLPLITDMSKAKGYENAKEAVDDMQRRIGIKD